jgi:hypothetical protein
MHGSTRIILLTAIIIGTLFAAGCTSPGQIPFTPTPPVTMVTTVPESAQSHAACSLQPGPTQIVPEYESSSVTVDRNTITEKPTITTRFNGGLGNGMIQTMTVTVIRSDCVTEQDHKDNPVVGTSITLTGTTKTDRVIATLVMTSGELYTVIDGDYPFPGS